MKFKKLLVVVAVLTGLALPAVSQRISYAEPERDDSRRTNFEIIGKVGENILVFKNNRTSNDISVYDNDMKLLRRLDLNYLDERWINVDFVAYPDHFWMIYQHQRKDIVYCAAVKLDGEGKRLTDPIILDTTKISWAASNKIYTTISSDDKKQVMILKINSKNPRQFLFSTFLFDENLQLKKATRQHLAMEERNDYFTDFLLDNQGGLVFGKFLKKSNNDYVTQLHLVSLPPMADTFRLRPLVTNARLLDEVKIKVDNNNNRYLFTALYYKQKRGNVEGLYSLIYDRDSDSILRESTMPFSDDLRKQAKGQDANMKLAFNDYFIRNMVMKKDGGYVLIGESQYTSTRGSAFNRWDYLGWNNPWSSPLNYYYYSPYYSPWSSPWNRFGSGQAVRHHSENIMILSFDKDGQLEWSNVIPKTQFDDETDALISYQMMVTGGEIHFLFNQYERRSLLLSDQSIGPDGKITRYPTLKNLDRGFEFMPRYAKQISARSIVIPCQYRNYLTFAKVDF